MKDGIADSLLVCHIAPVAPLQHTLNHQACSACEENRRQSMAPEELAALPLPQAAAIWLASRRNINDGKHSTKFMYECYFKPLTAFFGDMTLSRIADSGPINSYIIERARGGTIPNARSKTGFYRPAGPSLLRHEINALKQVLERAALWAKVSPWVELPPARKSTRGRALSEEEKERLFRTAGERSRWMVAYCCATISANTTADRGEIRHLRLRDVELERGLLHIREGVKNANRVRSIPMNDACLWAARKLYERALKKGSIYPHHYLLPHRAHVQGGSWDPLTPMHDWRSAWTACKKAAGLETLRFKDLRHTAITDLLANPNIAERVVIEIAGHVDDTMLDTYSHQRLSAKAAALSALNTGKPPKGESLRPLLVAAKKPQVG